MELLESCCLCFQASINILITLIQWLSGLKSHPFLFLDFGSKERLDLTIPAKSYDEQL